MGKSMRRFASLGGAAAVVGSSLLFDGAVANALPYDNTDPGATGCANTGRVVRSAPMRNRYNGDPQGTVYLFYSSGCRTVWAKMSTGAPGCVPGADWCGSATVHRNSDGYELRCYTPSGRSSCSTRQLNDANVTSFAEAQFDNGPWSYYGKTGSY
ncbi:MAG TPA: DUF2690 domain-containing protein [Pseudonocardiaceae bacterium]|nr:DUF2690 domain-containing protein [Pseudonocardiaceae bacterium]